MASGCDKLYTGGTQMKLRNKQTGYIVELTGIICSGDITYMRFDDEKGTFKFAAHSLAELNEEWEDYEEAKEYWYIRGDDSSIGFSPIGNCKVAKRRKEIGNYFDTQKEAKKAVERLKKLQNLKNRGYNIDEYIDMLIERGKE